MLLFVVGCLLRVVCLLFVVVFFVGRCALFAVRWLLHVVCCFESGVCFSVVVGCCDCSLCVVCCVFAVCCSLFGFVVCKCCCFVVLCCV